MPFDHFDKIARIYNRAAKFDVPAGLLDLCALESEFLLLDAGGGTGRVTEALQCFVKKAFIADTSQGMLNYASKKGLISVNTPVEMLPFRPGIFNRIIMVDVLHHVLNSRQAIAELFRVLAPNGRIIIIEPDIHKFSVKLIAIIEKLLLMRSHFLSAEIIAILLKENDEMLVSIIHNDNNIWVCAEKVR